MHPQRLQALVATVSGSIAAHHRVRLDAHVEAAESCRRRIVEVKQSLRGALDGAGTGGSALDLACELDTLERVQERLDRYLTALVEELSHVPREVHYDDGVPV